MLYSNNIEYAVYSMFLAVDVELRRSKSLALCGFLPLKSFLINVVRVVIKFVSRVLT